MTENCNKNSHIIIIGAGIAGASVAYACARRGLSVRVLERHSHAAAEASGNPAGILYPFMARKWDAATSFYLQGFAYTVSMLRSLDARCVWHGLTGMLHSPKKCADAEELMRLQGLAASLGLPDSVMSRDAQGFFMPYSGWVNVPAFCAAMLTHSRISCNFNIEVTALQRTTSGWNIHSADGEIWQAQHVVIANAYAANQLLAHPLPLRCIRGQITYLPATYVRESVPHVYCYGGYMTPYIHGIHYLGATFEKERSDVEVDAAGHNYNLATLRTHFPELVANDIPLDALQGRAALRTVSGDRLPIIGRPYDAESGIFLSLAHGARGLVSAPLAGEMLACDITKTAIDIVDEKVKSLLSPARFFLRKHKKQR
jgi:tRNA 5-methylaminomethyl-2-thiouridine biosynthesis bifunctional protein